ncbi:hypothetical protein DS901_03920 [Loktanella sp. D2R18]|uniref:hypothetical protein n=1 Tax=Rhodobacterales TaxID=204455 RepID=UPI000DE9B955|nr:MULTISPECIES: hypothetical protein [Rhodobacterales]MCG3268935.1 hypothetical protein [Yoonia sp. I 8.24]MDO6589196.1 hypothetical protein [Yoonia sp. 1_MG-2023]RBW45378.1 hypothetical protein DS901_03920 [Loktanella sp. D2R18]
MQKSSLLLAAVAAFGLAGCIDTDGERAVAGAGAGLVAAEILGTDPVGTAAVGAAAGVFCDDAGICN